MHHSLDSTDLKLRLLSKITQGSNLNGPWPTNEKQISTLLGRLDEPPERLICITGPRQTGKTTMVRQALARIDRPYRYLPVDEPEQQTLPELLGIEDGSFAGVGRFRLLGHARARHPVAGASVGESPNRG